MLEAIDSRCVVVALCAATFLFGSCSDRVAVDEYQRGNAFLDGGQFEKAAETWQPLADAGHLEAQLDLAALYTQGLGVPQDFSRARDLYEKAAGQGSRRGEYYLGVIYAQGDGVEPDQTEALRWFMLAAGQGHVKGQLRVADAYYRGQGFERDFAEAYSWYSRAADSGESSAIEKAALIGEQASYSLAAEDVNEAVRLAAMLHLRGDTATARRLLTKFADLGLPEAQNELGYLITLLPGEKDYAQAAELFRLAASQNHPGAQNNLGMLYKDALGVEQNYDTALGWFRKSIAGDYPRAMVNLGYMYANGLGVEANSAESFRWNLRAAELGSAEGQVNTGRKFFAGRDVAQDYEIAAQWFRKAAEQGYSRGQALLAGMYYVGHGVAKDNTLAYQWFVLAIANARSAEERSTATEMFDLLLSELDASEVAAGSELVRRTLTTERAAAAGDPQAQVELGYVRAAQGDDQAARRLFSTAAERGLVEAMTALGGWHMLQQTQAHHVQSLTWYLIAAKHGDEKAMEYAATLTGALPADRVEEAKRAADQWRRRPADGRMQE